MNRIKAGPQIATLFCVALKQYQMMYITIHPHDLTGVVRQSLTRLKVPRSHKSMRRRFETTQ